MEVGHIVIDFGLGDCGVGGSNVCDEVVEGNMRVSVPWGICARMDSAETVSDMSEEEELTRRGGVLYV